MSAVSLRKRAVALAVYLSGGYVEQASHAVRPAIFHEIGHTVYVCLHHFHRTVLEECRTGVARRMDDIMEFGVGMQFPAYVVLQKMERGVFGISAEARHSPLLVPSRCIHMIVVFAAHEYLHDAAADESGGSGDEDVASLQLFPRQVHSRRGNNIGLVSCHIYNCSCSISATTPFPRASVPSESPGLRLSSP